MQCMNNNASIYMIKIENSIEMVERHKYSSEGKKKTNVLKVYEEKVQGR